ncbi:MULTISPECIES: hypothetical protein [Halomonadaceae]|mgnify:CR=1 FL=1|uniref:Lipid/polyisoprenoid-binding YceI-like domain-containing protein n=1 Tax=Modicisalibacter zincidurans TaxID=1178777 RepID=A0ABP9R3L9_9GAMM|nr:MULTISPECIES: hypothetical protein [Halomonas]MCD6007304.1 hypothetical protein [Halomonas sp. IOP_31]
MDVRYASIDQRFRRLASTLLIAPLAAGLSLSAHAAWQLDPEQSQVTATIVEVTPNGPLPRTHRVSGLQGELSDAGTLRVPLRFNQTDVAERLGQMPSWLSGLTDAPLATVTAYFPAQRLDELTVGESLTDTVTLEVQSNGGRRQEPLQVRFTRESSAVIRLRNAERVVMDGSALMANQNARGILLLLGYEEIGDEIPVELDATLVDR